MVSFHRFYCFILKSSENDELDKANFRKNVSVFLYDALEYFSNLSKSKKGYINTGYDPVTLNDNTPVYRWTKNIINESKEKYKNDFDNETADIDKDKKVDDKQFSAFFWEFEPQDDHNWILRPVIQVIIGLDTILFRFSFNVDKEILDLASLKKSYDELSSSRWSYKTENAGVDFLQDIFHLSANEKYLKFLSAYELFAVKYKDYKLKIGPLDVYIDDQNKTKKSLNPELFVWKYPDTYFIDENQPSLENIVQYQFDSSEFLKEYMGIQISRQKISTEFEQTKTQAFKDIEADILKISKWIKEKRKELENTFTPFISKYDFSYANEKRIDLSKNLSRLNDLFNTARVNNNHYLRECDRYFFSNNRIIASQKRQLGKYIDDLSTLKIRLTNNIQNTQSEIDLLLLLGTQEISLDYASELIVSENQSNFYSSFTPMIAMPLNDSSKGFKIYRPENIKDARFESLARHYLEALYLLPDNGITALIEQIFNPQCKFYFSYTSGSNKEIPIGKWFNKCEDKFDAGKFLKELNCIKFDIPGKCGLEKISKASDQTEQKDDRSPKWIGINSMISFFEAICSLFNTPKHHSEILKNTPLYEKKRQFLFITGLLWVKVGNCEKARQYFEESILLAHKEQKFDWAFSVAKIASLCESCVNFSNKNKKKVTPIEHIEPVENKNTCNDKTFNQENTFRTKLASYFLDVFDIQNAIDITRTPALTEARLFKRRTRMQVILFSITTLIFFCLIYSSVVIYNDGDPNNSSHYISRICTITWVFTFIGAPVIFTIGTWRKKSGNLFPQILYPKYLSVITVTIITFLFSGKLIVSLTWPMKLPIIIIAGIIITLIPAIYLCFKWDTLIKDRKAKFSRILDFLSLTFLEACTLSAISMFIYGATFENKDSRYIINLGKNGWLYFSPIFILLASLVAVLFGIVFKDMLGPTGPESN